MRKARFIFVLLILAMSFAQCNDVEPSSDTEEKKVQKDTVKPAIPVKK